jgi:hypothetical protein
MDNIDKIRRIRLLIKTLSSIKIIELIEENPKMGVIVHLGLMELADRGDV